MKALLLCAGYGTRLYPLTKDQPKALLPVAGRPILDYLLEKLKRAGQVREVFVVTNERFFPHFKGWAEGVPQDPQVHVVNDGSRSEEERLGAIGDLAFVIKTFHLRDDLGVLAGDNLFEFELGDFFDFARSRRPHASVGVVDVKNKDLAQHYGIVRIGKDRRIAEFLEKPKEPPSTLASTGIYWFAKESLDLLDRYRREGHNADRFGDYIRWLVGTDQVFAYSLEGNWFDIGDLDSYRKADSLFKESRTHFNEKKGFP